MRAEKNRKRLALLQLFGIFFLLIAFVLTSSMVLFMTYLGDSAAISINNANVRIAALVTFGNTFFLSLICAAVDSLRRKATVERPVRRIIAGAEKVMDGDLSVRIEPVRGAEEGFNAIIDYFNRMVQELSGMETLRTDFIANVSHELKTPLAVINAANEVTEMETGETQWTRSIHTQTERLANLTEKLVMLSRMDEEGYAPNRAPFCISDAVKETAESFEAIARHKNREYTVNVAPGLRYDGDENAIRQLCGLLIDNAMKYSDEGGQIGVTLQKNGKHLELQVENTTPGIEKGDRSILFERFYRADASRNSATGGYGIGLSVAKAIVTAHKGKITAYSPDGKRILFTALL